MTTKYKEKGLTWVQLGRARRERVAAAAEASGNTVSGLCVLACDVVLVLRESGAWDGTIEGAVRLAKGGTA